LIPIIARKNYLTSASMRTADIVYQQAKELIAYYKKVNKVED